MLSDLPADIIYEITKKLCLKDICNIMSSCRKLYNNIKNYEVYIFHNELKKINKPYNIKNIKTLDHFFYNFLNYNIITHFYKFKKRYYRKGKRELLRNFILYEEIPINITDNTFINNLFNRVFYFYIKNNNNLKYYPNKFELCVLYNFLQIEIFCIYDNFNYWFDFLESFDNKYRDIKIKYYNSILDSIHNGIIITFDQMHTISKYTTSIYIIKKIMGYKLLDLTHSYLNFCCFTCNEDNLIEICDFKRRFYKDHLVSHNYNELKNFLYKENRDFYNILINRETTLVNNQIYFKNPITNKRVRLNSNVYKQLMTFFTENDNDYKAFFEYYIRILNYITRRELILRRRYFS
jgi:hypothetical protein